jgi:hypothetical protein
MRFTQSAVAIAFDRVMLAPRRALVPGKHGARDWLAEGEELGSNRLHGLLDR